MTKLESRITEEMLINDEAQMTNDEATKMPVIPGEVEESRSESSRAVPQDPSTWLRMIALATDSLFVIRHSNHVCSYCWIHCH